MVIAIHTFGNLLNHHPHLHGIVTNGCFDEEGRLYLLPELLDNKEISDIFKLKVLEMILRENKITELVAEKLMSWYHSGFNVHFGGVISPQNRNAGEAAARYLARSPISLEKMKYLPEEGKVIYGKPGGESKVFDAMDFLALAASHIANKYEHRVTYFGWWSNKIRGMRNKKDKMIDQSCEGLSVPVIIEQVLSSAGYRKRWSYFIKKIYMDDPLLCPKCGGQMRIAGFTEAPGEVKAILLSLNLWDIPKNNRAPPKKMSDSFADYSADIDYGWDVYCKNPVWEDNFREIPMAS